MTKRPNIVLFITDQQRADMLGCMGDPLVKTPCIDALAANGIRFDRFYVAMPSCMPNRAAILTSRYPSVNGVRVNGVPLPPGTATFPGLLADAGYDTALIGKGHHQPILDAPATAVRRRDVGNAEARAQLAPDDWWREELRRGGGGFRIPYYGYGHVEIVTGHGDNCGGHYEAWLAEHLPDYRKLQGIDNQLPHNYSCPQAVRTAIPEELYPTSYICERAEAFIRSRAGNETPFLLVVSFPDPHHPFNPPGRYWDMYDPDAMKLPANFTPGGTPAPHLAAAIAERDSGRAKLGGYGAIRLHEDEAREAIALTYGMISMIDAAVGRLRTVLRETEFDGSTIQIFTSDHGDLLGDHGLMLKGPLHYQSLIRVPFILSDPMYGSLPSASGMLASGIDIGVTLLGRAGVPTHNGAQGRSLHAMLEGRAPERDALLIEDEYQAPLLCFDTAPRLRTLVTREMRLTIFSDCEWGELYDLEDDPDEEHNLWDAPVAAPQRNDMTERLAQKMMKACDTSPFPSSLA